MPRSKKLDVLLSASLVLTGCGKGASSEGGPAASTQVRAAQGEFKKCEGAAAPDAKAAKPPTIPSRVYTDITPTMKGFAGAASKSTALREIHRAIDVAAGEATSPGPRRCSLGAKWVCGKFDTVEKTKCVSWSTTSAIQCATTPVDYGAPETYAAVTETSKLDEVLARKPVPAKVDPDHPAPTDWLDEAGLTVLVSSGLEPGPTSAAAGVSSLEACAAGPSPACVARALTERVKEGYGVWAVTAQIGFSGSFIADVPVDAKYVATTKAHLEQQKKVSVGESTPFVGIDFKVGPQTAMSNRGAAYSRFEYTGVRPLLILALSKNHEAGRTFVKSLVDRLKAAPALRPGKMVPDDVVTSVELAPLAVDKVALAAPELAPKGPGGQGDLDPAALAEFRPASPGASPNGAWTDINCGARGKGWLLARYTATPPGIMLPAYLKQSTYLEGPSSNEPLPDKVSVSQRAGEDPVFKLFVSCGPLAARPSPWPIEYLFKSKAELDEKAVGAAWFSKLSSTSSYEMPEKVYGLREVFTSVLRQSVPRDTCAQKIRLNVKRGT